jgi:uncharacterized protein YjdB
MLLCANSETGTGKDMGVLEWSSSDPQVAAVTRTRLPLTHCGGEISNAILEAKAPGTVNIIVNEFDGGRIVTTVAASVTVFPAVE